MTPQLSFDDIEPNSPGNTGLDGFAHLTSARCASPVDSAGENAPNSDIKAGSGMTNGKAVPLRKEQHLGGGALYALQGARLWLSPDQCRALVDRQAREADLGIHAAESDMTIEQEEQLERLSRGSWAYLEGEGRRMVRARIRYEGDVRRSVDQFLLCLSWT